MEFQIQNNNAVKAINSLEVAEMIDRSHSDLLKTIRQYLGYLAEGKISLGEFFVESTYKDVNNQERPCYLITKKGCDMVANKLTGKKGTIFTAKYVTRFEEMENAVPTLPNNPMEILKLIVSANEEVEQKVEAVESRVTNIEENTRLNPGQYNYLGKLVSSHIAEYKQVHNLSLNKKQNGEMFHGLNKEIIEITGVHTRADLRQKDFDRVCEFVKGWQPSSATLQKIRELQE